MIKKYFVALSATTLISVAPYALAASSTDLTVTGTITPQACTPGLSNGGVIDYGEIPASGLNPTERTLLGSHPMQLTVQCAAPVQFALTPIDNKAGTASNPTWFGLGRTDAGEKLGFVVSTVSSTQADGQAAQSIMSIDNGTTWFRSSHIRPTTLVSVASTADHSTPIAVGDLAMGLNISTYIAPADSLTLTDAVNIDGSVTFEMKYL